MGLKREMRVITDRMKIDRGGGNGVGEEGVAMGWVGERGYY